MQRTRNQHASHARLVAGGGSCAPLMPIVGRFRFNRKLHRNTMRFALPIVCVLTFGIACFGASDAIIPFGYLLVEFLKDESTPLLARFLLLLPFAATLFPSFVTRTVVRGVLTIVGVFLLTVLWLLGIIAYVIYPMPDNQIPNWVPAVTSVPFVLTVIGTMAYYIRTLRADRRKLPI